MAQFGALALVVVAIFVLGTLLAVNSPQGNFVLKTFVDKISSMNNKDVQQEVKSADDILLGDVVEKENQNEDSVQNPPSSGDGASFGGTRTDLTPPEPSFSSHPTYLDITPPKGDTGMGGGGNE